jgi:hypothetical protein
MGLLLGSSRDTFIYNKKEQPGFKSLAALSANF